MDKSILIINNNELENLEIFILLKEMGIFKKILFAHTHEEAVDALYFDSVFPDFILASTTLPDMDAYEFIKNIHENYVFNIEVYPAVYIILESVDDADLATLNMGGITGVLLKPLNTDALKNVVMHNFTNGFNNIL